MEQGEPPVLNSWLRFAARHTRGGHLHMSTVLPSTRLVTQTELCPNYIHNLACPCSCLLLWCSAAKPQEPAQLCILMPAQTDLTDL